MSPLGVSVATGETPQSAGISTVIGQALVVAPAIYGPETPTLVRSLSEAVALYGPREGESTKLYDALNGYFAFEGSRAYVNRVAGEGSPAAAKLEIEAGSTAKTLVVTAKYKGSYGNSLKVEVVENAGKTASTLTVLNPEGEALVTSGEYTKASELLAWGKTHETYVVISEGSAYSSGKESVVKVLAATKLASGANPTANEKTTIKTIEGVPKNLGPGRLIVPGNFEEKVHVAIAEHCAKNNRRGVCDLKEAEKAGTSATTLISEKGTYVSGIASYIDFFTSTVTAAGPAPNTSRTISFSGVFAGLMAKVARSGNNNQAPAGRSWPLTPFVTGITNTYSEADMERLNNAGLNNIAERFGVLCLYGDRTALSAEVDPIFYQYSAANERMQLVAESEEIGEQFLFGTLDGRHQKRAKFQAELQSMIKRHWENGALYGETAQEAGVVNVGEPINTLATEQAGELRAELIVRISPVAEAVKIIVTARPITEAV